MELLSWVRVAALGGLGLLGAAWAADAPETAAGMVKTLKGVAHVERGGQRLPISVGTVVHPRDRLVSGPDTTVGLTLRDDTRLTLGPNSSLDLAKFAFNSTTHQGELSATVKRGTLAVISGKVAKASPEAVQFNTATVTLGVRGTAFVIETEDEDDEVAP